jgi:hypothetical protein
MSMALLVLFAAAVWGPGWLPGAVALLIAAQIFLADMLPGLSLAQGIVLGGLILAVPAAAYLAGVLLNAFALSKTGAKHFSTLAVVLTFCLVLEADKSLDYFAAAVAVVQAAAWPQLSYIFAAAISALVFCGGLAALVIMILHLLFELPVLWLSSASRVRVQYAFAAMRPLSVIIGAALLFNLIVELFAANLWPTLMKG